MIAEAGVPSALLRNGWHVENHLVGLDQVVADGVLFGAAGEGRFSAASRADYAAAAAAVLVEDGHAGACYELAGNASYTLADVAAEIARRAGRPIAYRDLDRIAYRERLLGAGLPAALAEVIADADRVARDGSLRDDGGILRKLIERPTVTLGQALSSAMDAEDRLSDDCRHDIGRRSG